MNKKSYLFFSFLKTKNPKLLFFCILFVLASIHCYLICKNIDSTISDYGLCKLIRNIFVLCFLTFSNLCYVYVALTSIFVEKKINFLSGFRKNIDLVKKNTFVFFLIFVLLICLINCIRQPIFFIIGWDYVLYNLFSYIICMTSTVVPVVYTLCVLEKRIKTGTWNFSFIIKDLNKKINYFSVFIYIFLLIISFVFIKPLIPFIISNFAICKHVLISGFFENMKMVLNKFKPIVLVIPVLLSKLEVEDIFRHFDSNIFSNTDVAGAVDSNPRLKAENTAERTRVKYSDDGWLTKKQNSDYVKNNMITCADNILVPFIPKELFYSFWDVTEISNQLNRRNKDNLKQTTFNIFSFYFNPHNNFFTIHGGPSSQNWNTTGMRVWENKPPMDMQTIYDSRKHCALVGRNNKNWSYILQELPRYCDYDIWGYRAENTPYLIFYKDQYIAFAEFNRNYHGPNSFKTPTDLNQNDTQLSADYTGILGLVATTKGVETVPQRNIYSPQLAFYDITNEKHAFAIHMQFKYLTLNKQLVQRDAQHIAIFNNLDMTQHATVNLTEPVTGRSTYDVGLMLNRRGMLIRP